MKFLERLLQKKIDHIGLDIGNYAIKLVELKQDEAADNHQVVTYGKISLPANSIVDGMIKNEAAVTNALMNLKEERKLRDKATVNVSVSGRNVMTRTLKLPVMPIDELSQAVMFEAEKYIPTPIEQLYFDYTVLGEVVVDNVPQYNILLAAVPKEMIDTLCSVVEAANFKLYGIEIEPLGLYRMWHAYYHDEALVNQAILNMGHTSCNLVVFQKNNIQFTRIIPIAGLQMTEAIIQVAQKEVAAAIELKHRQRLHQDMNSVETDDTIDNVINLDNKLTTDSRISGEQCVLGALNDTLSSLTQEIQRSIDFYQMQAKVRLDRLIITGGSAELQGLDNYLETELGLPVLIGAYGELDPTYSLASGLAMKDFMTI